MKKTLKILAYIGITFFVMFWIGILILSMVGGHSDGVKKEVESMAGNILKSNVTIVTLYDAGLFPDLKLNAETIQVGSMSSILSQGYGGYYIGKIDFAVPFWSIFWGSPVLEHLEVTGVSPILQKASWSIYSISAQKHDPNDESSTPRIHVSGIYQGMPSELNLSTVDAGWGYKFAKQTNVDGHVGDYPFSAVLNPERQMFVMKDVSLGPGDKAWNGHIEGTTDGWNFVFTLGQNSSLDVKISPVHEDEPKAKAAKKWQGDLVFTKLDTVDLDVLSLFKQKLGLILSYVFLPEKEIKLDMNIEQLYFADNAMGQAEAHVEFVPHSLEMSQLLMTGHVLKIPVDSIKQHIPEIQHWSDMIDIAFDLKGDVNLVSLDYTDVNGTLKLTSSDGKEVDLVIKDDGLLWKIMGYE